MNSKSISVIMLAIQLVLLVVLVVQVNILLNKIDGVPANNGDDDSADVGTGGSLISADDDPYVGPKNAKVVVIEFSDFQCPYCGASEGTHQGLIQQFKARDPSWEAAVPKILELAEAGKIKFVYRDFPLSGHQYAQKSAEASECADEQGKYWDYHKMLFENQDALTNDDLKGYASDLGLDTDKFNECLDTGMMADEVRKDFSEGTSYGVSGTPAFFINDQEISGAQPFSAFESIINSELAK